METLILEWMDYFIPHYLSALKSVSYGIYATLSFLAYSHAMSKLSFPIKAPSSMIQIINQLI